MRIHAAARAAPSLTACRTGRAPVGNLGGVGYGFSCARVKMATVGAGELGRYGVDRADGDPDDARAARELTRHPYPRDFAVVRPPTQWDIELQTKIFRGEVRWDGDCWVESQAHDYVQREDRARRMKGEVTLPDA